MKNIINFFITRQRLNYTLAGLLLFFGILTYIMMPKELFPPVSLDKIIIQGGYAGSSPNNLDKLAVAKIEDEIYGINGITKVESVIQPGVFSITATLKESSDQNDILSKVKDAISKAKQDFPPDMDEPSATLLERTIPLLQIAVSSDTLTKEEMLQAAKKVEKKLSTIPHLSGIQIFGDSDQEVSIKLNTKKIEAYGLKVSNVTQAIANLSYIYPLGKVEQSGNFFYINSNYGKDTGKDFENALLTIGNKKIYLKDIADVEIKREDSQTRSLYNEQPAYIISVSKDEEGNAIDLADEVKHYAAQLEGDLKGITLKPHGDTSVFIKNRLHTVISNISLGFILVTLSMFILINWRISVVVALGIPFSFIIGVIFFDLSGNSINMISLLGALIAVGVLVDDAIIVAENIQRHLEMGKNPKEAAVEGAAEVFTPVLAATATTIFAFLPMLLIGEEIGKFIRMIPIALVILLIASLIESFLFLPLHSKDILKPDSKSLNWNKANTLYKKIITTMLHYKLMTVVLFLIIVPLLTFLGFKYIPFQLFPKFDGQQIFISGKLNVNNNIDTTFSLLKNLSKDIRAYSKEYYIKDTYSVAGIKVKGTGEMDTGENYFTIFLELEEPREKGFIHNYILPVLSFDFDRSDKIRTLKTYEIEEHLNQKLSNLKDKYNLEEFSIEGQRAGIVARDIDIAILAPDRTQLIAASKELKQALTTIQGVKDIGDDAETGLDEYTLKINKYGESLGLSEGYISGIVSSLFLDAKQAKSFGDEGVIYIKTKENNKDDAKTLENLQIQTPDGNFVALKDVVDIKKQPSFQKIIKENNNRQISVYANTDTDVITASKVLKRLKPEIEKLQKEGLEVSIGGEQEKNTGFIKDMAKASVVAMGLIFLTLLLMFDSFKSAIMILSVIPLSLLGAIIGHLIMGMNLSMPSVIGILGLAGVVINDGIIMLDFIKNADTRDQVLQRAMLRLRPIILTSITTLLGLSTLAFFPSGQAQALQPLAISLGFGLAWGTVLNLIYLPSLYTLLNRIKT